ncbi:hypothetical protein SH528x_002976 [Novipirellula sp. SH528]
MTVEAAGSSKPSERIIAAKYDNHMATEVVASKAVRMEMRVNCSGK